MVMAKSFNSRPGLAWRGEQEIADCKAIYVQTGYTNGLIFKAFLTILEWSNHGN